MKAYAHWWKDDLVETNERALPNLSTVYQLARCLRNLYHLIQSEQASTGPSHQSGSHFQRWPIILDVYLGRVIFTQPGKLDHKPLLPFSIFLSSCPMTRWDVSKSIFTPEGGIENERTRELENMPLMNHIHILYDDLCKIWMESPDVELWVVGKTFWTLSTMNVAELGSSMNLNEFEDVNAGGWITVIEAKAEQYDRAIAMLQDFVPSKVLNQNLKCFCLDSKVKRSVTIEMTKSNFPYPALLCPVLLCSALLDHTLLCLSCLSWSGR
jgi:hypothetical protein